MIELNYGKDQFPQGNTVSVTNFNWVRENYDWLKNYIDSGVSGGVGIFEGVPFKIEIQHGSETRTVFDGYLDLTKSPKLKDRIDIETQSTSHATVDWVNDVASSFSFEYLASLPTGAPGAIGSSDYVWMPYVLNSVPNYEQAAIATLMVYSIEQAIAKEIEEIANILADAAGYFTTIPAIVKLVLKIAYLLVLIITLVKLIKDLMKFIISPVKYHAGMYVRDSLTKACEYLGLTLQSEIWAPSSEYYNEFILPEKHYNVTNADSIFGFLAPNHNEQVGYYKGTFANLLDAIKTKYNAKIIVTTDNKLIIIRKDKNAQPPAYQLPDIYEPNFTYNTDELQANTLIEYQLDNSEQNTYQNYAGTIYQVICQPVTFNNRAFVMMKNFNQVSIPFARATRKTELTIPEKIIDDFLEAFDTVANIIVTVVNSIIGVVNDIISVIKKIFRLVGITLNIPSIPTMNQLSLGTIIDNRIGMLVLTYDYFTVPKILIITEGSQEKYNKVHASNDTIESAKSMWDNYHYVNSFVPAQLNPSYSDRPTGNQYVIKTFPKVPFTWQDYLAVATNNRILDAQGNQAIVESLKFNPYKQMAEITVRFSKIYTLNLKETYLNPTGA